MLTVLGWASPLPLGPSMSLALHGASAPALRASTLGPGAFGRAAARTFTAFVSPTAVVRFRLTASAHTFIPCRGFGPMPPAVATRTVDRALGPATATLGI